jgi:hypothetical protein
MVIAPPLAALRGRFRLTGPAISMLSLLCVWRSMLPDLRVAGLVSIILAVYLLLPHPLRITIA